MFGHLFYNVSFIFLECLWFNVLAVIATIIVNCIVTLALLYTVYKLKSCVCTPSGSPNGNLEEIIDRSSSTCHSKEDILKKTKTRGVQKSDYPTEAPSDIQLDGSFCNMSSTPFCIIYNVHYRKHQEKGGEKS